MRRSGLACFIVLAGTARLASAADTWVEVRSAHFAVVSNAGEGTARKTAGEFEQARAAYGKIWPWTQGARTKPVVVLALKDEGTMRRWAPGFYEKSGIHWVSGWAEGADRVYMLLRTDSRPDSQEVAPNYNLYRGYLRILLSTAIERRLPEWLSAGLAGVLGNVSVRDKEILIGRPVPWEFRRFNGGNGRLPLQAVLDVRHDSPLLRREAEREMFDAQSYVLVHDLLFGDRVNGSKKLEQFQKLWAAGAAHDKAFREALGDVAALETEMVYYASRKVLSAARFDIEAKIAAERPPARALSPGEVAGLQALVHVAMNRPVEAQAAIRQARSLEPKLPASYDAEGVLADRDRDKARAREAYTQAAELGSTSPYTHYRAAQLLWSAAPDAATLALMRQRLERAVELDANDAAALSFLAETLVQQAEAARGVELALRAVKLAPGESYHRAALARALHAAGRLEDARKLAAQALQLADDDDERGNAERLALFLDESARFAKERTERESAHRRAEACQGGDDTACGALVPELERSCGEGVAANCSYLAWLHREGRGVPKDAAQAATFVSLACSAGDKRACVELGWLQVKGEGLARDERKGRAALDALCSGGFAPACTRLGFALLSATAPAERARAKAALARACEGGEQDACSAAKQLR